MPTAPCMGAGAQLQAVLKAPPAPNAARIAYLAVLQGGPCRLDGVEKLTPPRSWLECQESPLPVSPRCYTALVICCESPGTAPGPTWHASLPAAPRSPGINAESKGSPRAEAFWQLFWEQLQGLECTACGILGGCSGQPLRGVLSLVGMQGWDGAMLCSKTTISWQGGLVALRNKPPIPNVRQGISFPWMKRGGGRRVPPLKRAA